VRCDRIGVGICDDMGQVRRARTGYDELIRIGAMNCDGYAHAGDTVLHILRLQLGATICKCQLA
jgi:hypothetical protein